MVLLNHFLDIPVGSTYQTDIGIYRFIGTDPGDFTILKSCQ